MFNFSSRQQSNFKFQPLDKKNKNKKNESKINKKYFKWEWG